METTIKPSEAQIQDTIQVLQKRLKEPGINSPFNRTVKEGYNEAINILAENRNTYQQIGDLSTQQGRAIAVLAVDYLNGECTKQVLTGVPIKR